MDTLKTSIIVGEALIVLLLVIFLPLLGIWAINTLFGVNTPYNFWTWLASMVFFGSTSGIRKRSSEGLVGGKQNEGTKVGHRSVQAQSRSDRRT